MEKILFAMLGRHPDAFGIVLDEGGWFSIKELHQAVMKETGFHHITPRDLTQFFSLFRPEKFEWKENFVRVKPELQSPDLTIYKEAIPPELLYVSIRPKAHAHVIARGLQSINNRVKAGFSPALPTPPSVRVRTERFTMTEQVQYFHIPVP
jgi:putative RNA 2'-phosphotransferase